MHISSRWWLSWIRIAGLSRCRPRIVVGSVIVVIVSVDGSRWICSTITASRTSTMSRRRGKTTTKEIHESLEWVVPWIVAWACIPY